ncbi:hypothetical protein GCM10009565_08450 [Amycolatopsis albidoflavus]
MGAPVRTGIATDENPDLALAAELAVTRAKQFERALADRSILDPRPASAADWGSPAAAAGPLDTALVAGLLSDWRGKAAGSRAIGAAIGWPTAVAAVAARAAWRIPRAVPRSANVVERQVFRSAGRIGL